MLQAGQERIIIIVIINFTAFSDALLMYLSSECF